MQVQWTNRRSAFHQMCSLCQSLAYANEPKTVWQCPVYSSPSEWWKIVPQKIGIWYQDSCDQRIGCWTPCAWNCDIWHLCNVLCVSVLQNEVEISFYEIEGICKLFQKTKKFVNMRAWFKMTCNVMINAWVLVWVQAPFFIFLQHFQRRNSFFLR